MEKVERRERKDRPALRKILPPILLLIAAVVAVLGWITREEAAQVQVEEKVLTAGVLEQRTTDEVQSILVELSSGGGWYAEQTSSGILTEKEGFELDASIARTFLQQAAVIGYEDIFTSRSEDYADRLEEFGLDKPSSNVTIRYRDGSSITLRIGDRSTQTEAAYYYMTVDGHEPLYAISVSTAEDWKLSRNSLYTIEQPVLQTARMDHLILEEGEWKAEWKLAAEVTDANASDAWVLLAPVHYPADGNQMTAFLKNIGNLRLGAYEGEATQEHLAQYGLLEPEMTLTLHMAEGKAAVTGADGAVSTQTLDEETVVLTVGRKKNDLVRYVRYKNAVYLVSTLTLGPVMEKDPMETVTRYPVLVAAEYLHRLTIEDCTDGQKTEYLLEHELQEDTEQSVIRCYENGREIPFETFEAQYLQMVVCSVSGELPKDYEPGELRKVYTFEAMGGKTHTIRLYAFDGLHDAVQVDEYPILFYLIEGGLGM